MNDPKIAIDDPLIFTITRAEILSYPYEMDRQHLLLLLKEKGAPIKGKFYFSFDRRFNVREIQDQFTSDLTFIFTKKGKLEK